MNLSVVKGINGSWTLIWDQYEGFFVNSYRIYRGTRIDDLSFIGSTTSGNFNFNDFEAPEGEIFYQIEVVSPYYCNPSNRKSITSYSSSKSNIVSNTINEVNAKKDLSILTINPNPASEIVELSFTNQNNLPYNIQITDISGNEVYVCKTNNARLDIPISNLKPGIYLVEASGYLLYRGKLVISR
jgi:intracellular sulfur oxidation DsrE/DsrF family protein